MKLDVQLLSEFIKLGIQQNEPKKAKLKKYMDYYNGEHEILNRTIDGEETMGKPNNKLIFNFCEIVIETQHGFLFSNPPKMDNALPETDPNYASVEEFLTDIENVYFLNDEANVTSSQGKTSSIYGKAVELHYIDTEGNIRFQEFSPLGWVDLTLPEYGKCKLHYYSDFEFVPKGGKYERVDFTRAELYTSESVITLKETEKGYILESETPHFYGEVPVVYYVNKTSIEDAEEGQSDLKNVLMLNDNFNRTASDLSNTLEYHSNPILIAENIKILEEDLAQVKDARILNIVGGVDSKVQFLEWSQNTEAFDSFLDRTEKEIYQLSMTPNMFSEESMGNLSGVAIRMRMENAELKANQKEANFKKGLGQRLRLLAKQLELKTNKKYFTNEIYKHVDISFQRNLPVNETEVIDNVVKLAGTVAETTRIAQLPFVKNAVDEIEKRDAEQGASVDIGGMLNGTGEKDAATTE